MEKLTLRKAVLCALTAVSTLSFSTVVSAGFYTSGGDLYDANGSKFVMRGINHSHTWYTNKLDSSLSGIAGTGANTVRVVLSTGHKWTKNGAADVANVIKKAKEQKLVAVLDAHDTTGYGDTSAEASTSVSLSVAVNYWISLKDQLIGQEDYVIINIGNEPVGNGLDKSVWIDNHIDAIKRLRAAGFTHTLMIDAPNWGQDWQNVMRDNASTVYNADSQKNIVFSVHMYEVYGNYQSVNDYMSTFANNGMPLVIGEFASTHKNKNVDEASIMERSEFYQMGYLGWSWAGNDASTADLDIAINWNSGNLSSWGDTLINGVNGISTTSVLSSVYTGNSNGGNEGYPQCSSASVDPDGDGWGWENGKSCQVIVSATPSYPICSSLSADPDGDGWGWENGKSCKTSN